MRPARREGFDFGSDLKTNPGFENRPRILKPPVVPELDSRPGSLPALLARGALAVADFTVLKLKQQPTSCVIESETVVEFGQRFRIFAVGGGDWQLARVHPDGSETYMGKTRDLIGWRPSGAPVGGWK